MAMRRRRRRKPCRSHALSSARSGASWPAPPATTSPAASSGERFTGECGLHAENSGRCLLLADI
uniref:Uncharacterized protein n=1 Tax=Oryza meridionalis TaxID=40149 RepID=A0A0E0CTQ3_9ORYZ